MTLIPSMWYVILFCTATFLLLAALILAARVRLESLRAELDRQYLALED